MRKTRGRSPQSPFGRRSFVLGVAASLPAAALVSACADLDEQVEGDERFLANRADAPSDRWRSLALDHIAAQDAHDLQDILRAYGARATLGVNGLTLRGEQELRRFYVEYGMSPATGGLEGARVTALHDYHAGDEYVVDGRIDGRHTGIVSGYESTGRQVMLHFASFYRFDRRDKIASQRLTIDWSWLTRNPLLDVPPPAPAPT